MLETNHERTLYVRYVFRNCLIYGERREARGMRVVLGSDRKVQHLARCAGLGLRREWRSHQKYLCRSQIRKQ